MNRELERMRKQSAQKVEAAKQAARESRAPLVQGLDQMIAEEQRVTEISRSAAVVIHDLERDFQRATKLTKADVAFLFLAVALQCFRQYALTPSTMRLDDKKSAKRSGKEKEHSDRKHRLYNPSLTEIITNPAPFDAQAGAAGALAGYGFLGHRGATPGHDPVVGLVVGTANIATSTLTNWRWESYHIYSGTYGNKKGVQDIFRSRAQTSLVASYTADKLLHQGMEGKVIIGASVMKEIAHLKSDVYSKRSLPLPVISVIDPKLAGELAKRGLDMASALDAGKQFTAALIIDALIGIIHWLFYYMDNAGLPRKMYEVRTRRVLLYSNLIASSSNIVVSALAQYTGVDPTGRLFDWGGYLNTLRRVAFDTKLIEEVKRDFLKNELYTLITGPQYDFMEGL